MKKDTFTLGTNRGTKPLHLHTEGNWITGVSVDMGRAVFDPSLVRASEKSL